MRSLKKVFWTGTIFLVVVWIFYGLFNMLYNFLGPVREALLFFTDRDLPGLEFVAFIFIVLILGFIGRILSKITPSKIPVIGSILRFTRNIHDIANKLNTGEMKIAKVKINDDLYLMGLTTGETIKIGEQEMIVVLLTSTPNPTTGYTFLVPKESAEILPKRLNKFFLKTILTAGLLR